MQLTYYTDYALRTLIVLAVRKEGATVAEIAHAYGISRNHLVKVAHHLGQLGYIETTRGRSGGLRLTQSADSIHIGEVVRKVESNFDIVECFQAQGGKCPIVPACALKGALAEARHAFMDVLDRYTLDDIVQDREELAALLGID